MSHRSCMGKRAVCSQYRLVLLATLSNHLAACCSTSSVPGFSGVCCRYHCAPEFQAHQKLVTKKSTLFSYLRLESPILALLCAPHAYATGKSTGGKDYFWVFVTFKKAVQIYFFQKNKIQRCNINCVRDRVGYPHSEVLLGRISRNNFTFLFHISKFHFTCHSSSF